ncbi:MAG: universal stress protein [Deltaproteobacteria bacterium]|jgi:nucleotide-binding universal stress UspA family protein|nr:MAG: universal stress protein [Deltaproteobacteria bacterium]
MKILVCTDGSEYGEKAVKAGAISAKYFGFEVTLLHVIEDIVRYEELPDRPGFNIRKDKAKAILSRAKKVVEEVGKDIKCREEIGHGPVASEIVRIAEVGEYDGIWVGTKGTRGIKRMLLGDVADDVIHHAHCPVTVVR